MIATKRDLRERLAHDKQQPGITRRPHPFTDEIRKYEIALCKYEHWLTLTSPLAKIARLFAKLRWHRWGVRLSIGIGPASSIRG